MAISYASNAILSKARAMYGKRLTDKDYSNLLGCNSVPEVLSYLKSHTKYAALLNNLSEADVHREQLEMILRQQLFFDFESLCRYEITVGEDFSKYIIMRTEIDQIMHFLMLLSSGCPEKYFYALPLYFTKLSKIDLKSFAKVKTYDEFLTTLGHTQYYKILVNFKPKDNRSVSLPKIENALNEYLFSSIYFIIQKRTKGEEQKELKKIFDNQLDMRNFVRILRLKKYYKYSPEKIKQELLPNGALRDSQITAMCNAEDSKSVFAVMQSTIPGRIISKVEYTYPGEITQKGLFNLCKHELRFSVHPSVVLVSYTTLAEIELSNIINIIEGVRYQVDSSRVKDLLTYS